MTYHMIWMHGLGADASDMKDLAQYMPQLPQPIHHSFLQAPQIPVTINQGYVMPAWYDIKGIDLNDRQDSDGIEASASIIRTEIDKLCQNGVSSQNIFLVGFSQGGAMALYTGLTESRPLAGIIAMSAYLPLADNITYKQNKKLPIFMTVGRQDMVVNPLWSQQSLNRIQEQGYVHGSMKDYSMGHAVCHEALQDIGAWLNEQMNKE